LKTSHKIELVLIALTTLATAMGHQRLPHRMEAGFFILTLGLLFLVQNLVRDLWLLSRKREVSAPKRAARCMCLETGVGIIPIIVSAILMFGGFTRPITLPSWAWTLSVPATMLTCFWLKDYVFEWNPWRIRRDDDHINIIFTWRS
jgi:hypothetical protein